MKREKTKTKVSAKISKEKETSSKVKRGVRLKRLRNMAGLSRKDVEKKYQISANTLRSWEDGIHTGLTEQGAKRILLALRGEGIRCSIGWLLNGDGAGPDGAVSKLFPDEKPSRNKKTASNFSSSRIKNKEVRAELDLFCDLHKDAIYTEVFDDGMEPFYKEGDYVAGLKHYDEEITDVVGKNCIVETQMGESYVRQLRSGSKAGYYNLICLNTQTSLQNPTIYDVELVFAAPIIWHRVK